MNAEIVAVGTEILLGQTVDTNSAELGKTLAKFGVSHTHRQTVGDNRSRLSEVLRLALSRSDIVFTIGGLGPTQDDLTRHGIIDALSDELVYDEEIENSIREKMEARGLSFSPNQRNEAFRPSCSETIKNENGTAPGLICSKEGKTLIALPGPPNEFLPMVNGRVSELLKELSSDVIHSLTLRVVGIGESKVEHKLGELINSENPTVAPYAKTGEVHLRVTARANSVDAAEKLIAPLESSIRGILGDAIYATDDVTLEETILEMIRKRGDRLAVAESCTGGGLGEQFTSVPGASDVFLGGIISYSCKVKEKLLRVSAATLKEHGAVSEQCAKEMAEGVCKLTGADWGVSITGVAGPGGGSDEKPVGLVYIGIASPHGTKVTKNNFPGDRATVRERAKRYALRLLREQLIDDPSS